jgi:carboxyl-terminal processing protease
MPPRHLNVILIAAAISLLCYFTHLRTRSAILVGDALNMIDAYYVDPVDRGELLKSAMNGLTSGLDQHSEFISNDDYVNFQDSIHQEFAGIGIYVEESKEGGPVRIITPLVGSPALEAGLLPGDEILNVDGVDVSSMSLRDVSARLKGPMGTTVALTLRRGKQNVDLTVRRDRIELESIVGDYRDDQNRWVFRLRDDDSIAYLRITSFGEKTTAELRQVLTQLDNQFRGMVIDLRGNGGGLLNSAVEVADMFLDSGNIVSTRIRGGVIEDTFDATPGTLVDPNKPLAILIDGSSASASEIVAASLQDHGRAVIVGTRSYGKGTVQNILPLQYGRSALRLTVARYYRPSGVNIHRDKDAKDEDHWGVSPNEGAMIDLNPEDVNEIAKRWREAAYPSLVGVEMDFTDPATIDGSGEKDVVENEVVENEVATDEVTHESQGDSQLARALELIREMLQAIPADSDSVKSAA